MTQEKPFNTIQHPNLNTIHWIFLKIRKGETGASWCLTPRSPHHLPAEDHDPARDNWKSPGIQKSARFQGDQPVRSLLSSFEKFRKTPDSCWQPLWPWSTLQFCSKSRNSGVSYCHFVLNSWAFFAVPAWLALWVSHLSCIQNGWYLNAAVFVLADRGMMIFYYTEVQRTCHLSHLDFWEKCKSFTQCNATNPCCNLKVLCPTAIWSALTLTTHWVHDPSSICSGVVGVKVCLNWQLSPHMSCIKNSSKWWLLISWSLQSPNTMSILTLLLKKNIIFCWLNSPGLCEPDRCAMHGNQKDVFPHSREI